uniref:Probable rRNA-processing protein EBP2 n=1 Tax=Zeugodacus cucurbitae TaxID=28588 RepID=A0A0A1X852_ZEUCU
MRVVCTSSTGNKLKAAILSHFGRLFGSMEHSFLLAASTFLDPRFKKTHFKDPLALASVMKHIRNELTALSHIDESIENIVRVTGVSKKHDEPSQIQDELTFFLNARHGAKN